MIALRSLLFNIAFYINLIVLMVLGLPAMLGGRAGVFFMARLWGETSLWLLEKICALRVEFRGLENIPQGGYIIGSKHQSFLESFAMLRHAPDFSFILKRDLMFIPLFGLYLVVGKQIGINRASGRAALNEMIEKASAALRGGRQIFIYPEGTRRPPGAPAQYKFGIVALYEASGAPILPVAINTGLYWGRRGFLRMPGTAIIEYLPIVAPGLGRAEAVAELSDRIEAASDALNRAAIAHDPTLGARMVSEANGEQAAR